ERLGDGRRGGRRVLLLGVVDVELPEEALAIGLDAPDGHVPAQRPLEGEQWWARDLEQPRDLERSPQEVLGPELALRRAPWGVRLEAVVEVAVAGARPEQLEARLGG